MDHVVILAGGGGTRLWPASTKQSPKQFLSLGPSNTPLLQETVDRVSPLVKENLWVVTAQEQKQGVADTLKSLPEKHIVSEPLGRNTAAAIGLAATYVIDEDPQAVIGFVPSDHVVLNIEAFQRTSREAFAIASASDDIVTIAVTPTRPETGYGYLELGDQLAKGGRQVKCFVEKPDKDTAINYLESKRFAWNAGMFFAKASVFLEKIRTHLPKTGRILADIGQSLGDRPADIERITADAYRHIDPVSIDVGVMEKETNIVCLEGDFGWNDIGSWASLAEIHEKRTDGNTCLGAHITLDSKDNIIVSDNHHLIATLGVSDLVIVHTERATLITTKDKAQNVRDVVKELEKTKQETYL